MTTLQFLSDLRKQEIHLWAERGRLRYRAPRGVISDSIRSELAKRKAEILAILNASLEAFPLDPSVIREAAKGRPLPLSLAEEGLWLLDQLKAGAAGWNMGSVLRLQGPLNVAALKDSLNALVQRHEILRTCFQLDGETPIRVIAPKLSVPLYVRQLDSSSDVEQEIRRIATEDAKQSFDLTQAPLFRVQLLRVHATDHIWIFTRHHIIHDGWSSRLFSRELFSFYKAFSLGAPPALAALPIQYSDYALWRRHRDDQMTENHLSYWRTKLDGLTPTELPSEKPRPQERSFDGATEEIQLSIASTSALRQHCRDEQSTPFMLLVAAFKVLMHRYTGNTDIAVGAAIAGRSRPEFESLLGMFVDLVVLRSDLSGKPSFRDLLNQVQMTCLDAYQHQELSFDRLLARLNPTRLVNRNPYFQVLFDMVNLPSEQPEVPGLTVKNLNVARVVARYEFTIRARETTEGIAIQITYSSDLFSRARVREMLEQYKYLLEQVVESPDRPIGDYSLLTASAKKLLPDPTAPLDDRWYGAVHELFAQHAARHPEKAAVGDATEELSYRDLDERSNQLAHYFIVHGIGREDVVAIYAHRSAALVWALLGVLKSGAAFCMIDPSHPAARVRECLSAAAPKALIQINGAGEPNAEMEEVLKSFSRGHRLASARASQVLSPYSTEDPAVNVSPDDLAYVIFTSGSTGKPKGVMGRHGPLTHFLPWLRDTFELSENDRFSQLTGLSSNILQREVFTALSLGATLCIPSVDGVGTWARIDEWLREKKVSVVHLTPAMIQVLENSSQQTIPSVRQVFFAGDLLRMGDVDKARRLMPAAEVANFYNSSETQRAGGYQIFRREEAGTYKDVPPLGRGIRDVQLLVLDRRGRLAGVGELGEIHVRSPHLARGYLGDDELTKTRFIVNPFARDDADRLYRTGEFGRFMPDGSVEFAARGRDQVSIRGFRIELGEIQAVLTRHPAVQDAVITAKEDTPGNNRLVAYTVLKKDHAATMYELRAFVKKNLPGYMVPGTFVFLESLPLNPSGKIDYGALPAPDVANTDINAIFLPPVTALEKVLAQSWAEILGVERVGIQDNFFELGGHSLVAMQLIARIEHAFKVELPLRSLYEAPTVADFAAALLRASHDPVRTEKTALLLLQLAQFSEDQVEKRLQEKASSNLPAK
jgi:amino acid adenylation domain-containing protein